MAPIDGSKISMCCLPSHGTFASNSANTSNEEKSEEKNTEISMENNDNLNGTDVSTTLSNYVLIAAKDSKSGRCVSFHFVVVFVVVVVYNNDVKLTHPC